jgi:CRP-like cAMP-binding protein
MVFGATSDRTTIVIERLLRWQMVSDLRVLARTRCEKRLARALLLLANFGKDGRPEPVIAKVSQETLAELIGTTRSRVSHFMNKFRNLGFIDYNGHLEVHTSLLNVVLHDEPQISGVHEPVLSENHIRTY